jgi:hypothetical protein
VKDYNTTYSIKKALFSKEYASGRYVVIAVIALLSFCFYFMHHTLKVSQSNIEMLREELAGIKETQTISSHYLMATISHNEARQKKVLFIKDFIDSNWIDLKRCVNKCEKPSPQQSFDIADQIVKMGEVYPDLDPLLLMCLQWKESKFNTFAKSPVGALGISQIMPSTGRMLAKMLGIAYEKDILLDFKTNTNLSAEYLNTLYKEHRRWDVVLAEYNGGHWGALYYRTGNPKLAKETKNYVPAIMSMYETAKVELEKYKPTIKAD